MDIDYLEKHFGEYFRDKRGLYVIRPGSEKVSSNIHSVEKRQRDEGGQVSANLSLKRPLYKIGLAGLQESSTGILARLKDYQTSYPNGFQVIALFVKRADEVRFSEKQIFEYLEKEKVMYRRIGKKLHPSSGRTEWTGGSLHTILGKLQEFHENSQSNQAYYWRFGKNDAVLKNTTKKGKLLSSVNMNRIRDKKIRKNQHAKYAGTGNPDS